VIIAKEGRIGVCIDVCLEMSSGIQTPAASDPLKTESVSAETKSVGTTVNGEDEEQKQQGIETSDLLGLGMNDLSLEQGDRQRAGEPINLLD
jgi:hypothetical protein